MPLGPSRGSPSRLRQEGKTRGGRRLRKVDVIFTCCLGLGCKLGCGAGPVSLWDKDMLAGLRSPWGWGGGGLAVLNITSSFSTTFWRITLHYLIRNRKRNLSLSFHPPVVRSQDEFRVGPTPPLGSCGTPPRLRLGMTFWDRTSGHHTLGVT